MGHVIEVEELEESMPAYEVNEDSTVKKSG
jgi:hypothetical protein